jgi:hypothetical protein
MRTYSELIKLPTLQERYEYLATGSLVGDITFGGGRWLNQALYNSPEWRDFRREVIIRDNGNDLAMDGYEIHGKIIVHHLNPITKDDILMRRKCVFSFENVVCCSLKTHNAIHYGDEDQLPQDPIIRRPNDTIPWR